jgi:hypothetical protein
MVLSLIIHAMAIVATMAAMPEHVHRDESDGDQYPHPVCRYPIHHPNLSCLICVAGRAGLKPGRTIDAPTLTNDRRKQSTPMIRPGPTIATRRNSAAFT